MVRYNKTIIEFLIILFPFKDYEKSIPLGMTNVELFNNSSKPLMYINAKTVPKPPFLSVNLDNIYHIIDSGIILCIVYCQKYYAKCIVFF